MQQLSKYKYYRLCSCGTKIGSRSYKTMRMHRRKGHKVPMKRYRYE